MKKYDMKTRMLSLTAAALSAAGAWGYSINTDHLVFYFEERTNNNDQVVGNEVKNLLDDGKGWLQENTIYNTTNHNLTATSQPNFYRIIIQEPGVAVKAWGLSTVQDIDKATWLEKTASTNFLCKYDSKYATVSKVWLYVWLKWMRYNVQVELNDGEPVVPIAAGICYTNSIALPTPSRTGYDFQGWTNSTLTAALKGEQTGAGLQVQKDGETVELYAKWKPKTFTVTFKPNGEGATVAQSARTVTYDSTYGTLPAPEWTGHAFVGWFTDAEAGTQVSNETAVAITDDQTLFAHWSDLYTVTFRSEGGSVYAVSNNLAYGAVVVPPAIEVPDGMRFKGWEYGGTTYAAGANIPVYQDMLLTSIFESMKTRLTWSAEPDDGGRVQASGGGEVYGDYERIVTLIATPQGDKFAFAGWSDGATEATHDIRVIADTNLVAHFSLKSFTVNFFDLDGTTSLGAPQTVEYGEAATAPDVPAHDGMSFVGWNLDFSNVTNDMSVIAQYEANRYTVVYDANGGVGSMTNEVFIYGQEYQLQSNVYTRAVNEFAGWASSPDATPDDEVYAWDATVSNLTTVANGTNTLYAVWRSLLTDYSLAADCTNLILSCNDQSKKWDIDDTTGFASGASIYAEGNEGSEGRRNAFLTTEIEGDGTLTFRVKGVRNPSTTEDQFAFNAPGLGSLLIVNDTDGNWNLCVYNKNNPDLGTLTWIYRGKTEDARCWVDQVHWYPGKSVTVSGNSIDSVKNEVTEAILQKWDAILGENAASISTVVVTGPAVSNAVALLKGGALPDVEISGPSATLTFNEVAGDLYTLSFDTAGGSPVAPITQYGGTAVAEPAAPTRTGYTFAGWDPEFPATMPASNVTYTAQWSVNQYTLSFDTAGGTEVASITQDYDTAVAAPADPTRTGYTFAGWQPALLETVPASNVTFTAQWTVNQYTLSFDTAGGTPVTSITQDYGTAVEEPADPTRTGYTFAGWQPALLETVPASNVTFTAQWSGIGYRLSFYPNGAEGEIALQDGVYGTAFSLPSNLFTLIGYTLMGWATNATGEVVFADGETVSNLTAVADGRVELYAVWAIRSCTISFDTAGGSDVEPITQDYGTEVEEPAAPTRAGYTFVGWDPEFPETMPPEDLLLKAQWKANGPVVTFDANGGSVKESERVVDKGKAVGALPEPTRKGYTFTGWFTEASGGTQIKTTTKVKKNVTYYAQWTANKYKIKFNANGGTGTMKTLSATYGKNVTLTANAFKRTNWTFLGWATKKDATEAKYIDKQKKVKNLTAIDGKTVTLYAVWKRNTYTVKFNANGGEGATVKQQVNCGDKTALLKNAYKRNGFDFAGWATKKGGAVVYKNKAKVKDLAKNGKSVTLYAVWKPKSWAVGTFTDKKGKIAGKAATVTLTVASDGKISGKFVRTSDKKAFAFKADAFTAFSDDALCVTTTIAYGSKTCELDISVWQEETATVSLLLVTYKGKDYGEAHMKSTAK